MARWRPIGLITPPPRHSRKRGARQRESSAEFRRALGLDSRSALRVAGMRTSPALTPGQADGLSAHACATRFCGRLMTDTVLIIDFGSQVTQLIARRVREQGVYSEIVPFNRAEDALQRLQPKAVIL